MYRVQDVSKKDCNIELSSEALKTIFESIKILSKFSEVDDGSSDILCFGYMVEAVKL